MRAEYLLECQPLPYSRPYKGVRPRITALFRDTPAFVDKSALRSYFHYFEDPQNISSRFAHPPASGLCAEFIFTFRDNTLDIVFCFDNIGGALGSRTLSSAVQGQSLHPLRCPYKHLEKHTRPLMLHGSSQVAPANPKSLAYEASALLLTRQSK